MEHLGESFHTSPALTGHPASAVPSPQHSRPAHSSPVAPGIDHAPFLVPSTDCSRLHRSGAIRAQAAPASAAAASHLRPDPHRLPPRPPASGRAAPRLLLQTARAPLGLHALGRAALPGRGPPPRPCHLGPPGTPGLTPSSSSSSEPASSGWSRSMSNTPAMSSASLSRKSGAG